VVGGLISFGLIGIFVGPVVLAVAYSLFGVWLRNGQEVQPPAGGRKPSAT
jgi:predicted PurR-regulated permease PerM